MPVAPHVVVDPPLEAAEIDFIGAFTREPGRDGVRRVWPGQPSRRCPWRPSADGRRLELDALAAAAEPDGVATWLRFLSREFLAPSTAAALDLALDEGLRAGHRVSGEVLVGVDRRVSVDVGRVTEERLSAAELDAIVVDLLDHRAAHTER